MASISDTSAPVAHAERPKASERSNSQHAPGTGGSLLRAALRMALVLVIGIGILRFLSDIWQIFHEANGGYDFLCYYVAALVLRDHPTANIYDPHVLQMAALAHHAPVPGLLYMYPPLLAIIIIPLTWLPWHAALSVWTVFSVALWLASVALSAETLRSLLREAHPGMGVSWVGADARLFLLAVVAFMTLTFDPVATGIGLGQISSIIWFLMLLALALDQWGHPGLAGAALALAALIKVYPLVLLGYYLLRGRWRVVCGGILALVLLTVGMLPVLGVQGLLVTRGLFAAGDTAIVEAHNEALLRTPLWIAVLGGGGTDTPVSVPGAALVALIALAFVAGVLWATRPAAILQWSPVRARLARWRGGPPGAEAQLAATKENRTRRTTDALGYLWAICAMMLLAPVAWEHAYCWLLLPLVLGFGYVLLAGTGSRPRRRSALLLAVIILSYALTCADYPLGYDIFKQYMLGPVIFGHPLRPFFMLARPFGALLLWGAMGWLFLAASREASSSQRLDEPPASTEPPPEMTPRRLTPVLIGLLGTMEVARIAIVAVMVLFGATYDLVALLR